MDEGSDSWLIIPESEFINALAADAGKFWQPGDGHNLQAWARKTWTEIRSGIYDLPSGLNRAIREGDYKVPWSLQQRRDRHAMETGAERGHTGEEAWTIMTMDGEEVLSSVVHILGVFAGYMGYYSHKRTSKQQGQGLCRLCSGRQELAAVHESKVCLRAAGVYMVLLLQMRRCHPVQ